MILPPPCMSVGRQCRELDLTLRIAELTEDGPEFHDGIATWLLGHVERITFGKPYTSGTRLLVDVTMRVPCKYLKNEGSRGTPADNRAPVTCTAHGMRGRLPATSQPEQTAFRTARGITIVQDLKVQAVAVSAPVARRPLPTVQTENPCAGAPCRTGDNKRGAACCRDLTIEVVSPQEDLEAESLLRSRQSPYLCKVNRTDEDLVECEVISACGHLEADNLSCELHGLVRPGGAPAKPSICSEWPSTDPDSVYHPGCRLIPAGREAGAR
jgi:hypothetical protein